MEKMSDPLCELFPHQYPVYYPLTPLCDAEMHLIIVNSEPTTAACLVE